jgi:FKBP-type peptidyl-prolyl cis-trans isomerase FkpA
MKNIYLLLVLTILVVQKSFSQSITIPDSIVANGLVTTLQLEKENRKDYLGVQFGAISINFIKYHKGKFIRLGLGKGCTYRPLNIGTYFDSKNALIYEYNWQKQTPYKVYCSAQKDSTGTILAAYIFLPEQAKWKYIGSIHSPDTSTIRQYLFFQRKKTISSYTNTWVQKVKGGWYKINATDSTPPVLRPFSNVDSIPQIALEQKTIQDSLKTTATQYKGLYYTMLKEGTGVPVKPTDTVVIYYKGWLFSNGKIFDQTKEKPISFPLSRLISGWQIGLPLCKVGGKIRLFIPSGLAYGIRNVSTDIPPNSTLVFDVEVQEVK